MSPYTRLVGVGLAVMVVSCLHAGAQPSTGGAFTYQGTLKDSGQPANGFYDVQFKLFASATGGTQIGSTQCADNLPVSGGLLTASVNFGALLNGTARWVEIAVRADPTAGNCGSGTYTTLAPRQQLTATPYAAGLAPPIIMNAAVPQYPLISAVQTATTERAGYFAITDATSFAAALGAYTEGTGPAVGAVHGPTSNYGWIGSAQDGVSGTARVAAAHGGSFYNTSTTGGIALYSQSTNGTGLHAESLSTTASGVYGYTAAGAGQYAGVFGKADGLNGNGVLGEAYNGAQAAGLVGVSSAGNGVVAQSTSGTALVATSVSGAGLTAGSSSGLGLYATSDTFSGLWAHSNVEDGAVGSTNGPGKSGVYGYAQDAGSYGVSGWNFLPAGSINGSLASGTCGVFGASYSPGVTYGVRGEAPSTGYAGYFLGRGYFSDNVGIGTQSPSVPLQVSGGTDASLTGGGNIVVGQIGSNNIVIDNNEIMSRNNGITSPLYINALGGNVGIGTSNAQGFQLAVNGTAAKPGGGSWSTYSDIRLKKNIRPLTGSLDTLLSLRGVNFEYINPHTIHEMPGERTGMIAQEVEKVIPDWVDTGTDGMKRITYRGFEALAVEAMRELRTEASRADEATRARVAALEEDNKRLRAEVTEIRAALKAPGVGAK